MTIREWICERESAILTERASKLETMNAPQVLIDNCRKEAVKLANGTVKIGGEQKLLDEEYVQHKVCDGRKNYVMFNGYIKYYPQARYGRFICEDA